MLSPSPSPSLPLALSLSLPLCPRHSLSPPKPPSLPSRPHLPASPPLALSLSACYLVTVHFRQTHTQARTHTHTRARALSLSLSHSLTHTHTHLVTPDIARNDGMLLLPVFDVAPHLLERGAVNQQNILPIQNIFTRLQRLRTCLSDSFSSCSCARRGQSAKYLTHTKYLPA